MIIKIDFLKFSLGKLIQMAELESEKEAWGDESKLNGSSSIYQDINFNQSLDVSQNNITANASVLSMLKPNSRLAKMQQQKQQQLHDTSNIDTLVTKSLEISRSYRKLNFSGLNNNNNNNNNSITYEAKYVPVREENDENTPIITMSSDKKKQPPERKPRHTLTNSVTSTTSASLNGGNSQKLDNQFSIDKQNNDLQKKTENLIREYSDIRNKQEQLANGNNNFEDLVNELYQNHQKNGNKPKQQSTDNKDESSYRSLSSKHQSEKMLSVGKGGSNKQAAIGVAAINEISQIMSESMDNVASKKSSSRKSKGSKKLLADSHECDEVEEIVQEDDDEDTEDGDFDSDESDEDNDDDIEELILKDRLQKLNMKHESTKAFISNDEEEDDDDEEDY